MVRWLGLCILTASGQGSVLGWETKFPQAAGCGTHTEDHSSYFAGNHRAPATGFSPHRLEYGPNSSHCFRPGLSPWLGNKIPTSCRVRHTHRGPQQLFCRESQGPCHRILPSSFGVWTKQGGPEKKQACCSQHFSIIQKNPEI